MAAGAPSHTETAEPLQKLSLDQTKTLEIPEPTKKPPVVAKDANSGQFPASISPGPAYFDPAYCFPGNYPAFYYGNFDGVANDSDEYLRSANSEGVAMPLDMYHGYGPCSPAGSPAPTMGPDWRLYQCPAPHFLPLNPSSIPYTPTPTAPTKGDYPIGADKASLSVEAANGNTEDSGRVGGVQGNNGSAPTKQTYLNSQFGANFSNGRGALPSSGFQDPRMGFNGSMSHLPLSEYPLHTDAAQPRSTYNKSMVSSMSHTINNPASSNRYYQPLSTYMGLQQPRQVSNMGRANEYINKMCGKYNSRSKSNGLYVNETVDGPIELNRGPRAKNTKNQKANIPVPLAVKSQNTPSIETEDDEKDKLSAVAPVREQYNKVDFPEVYSDAKFFIIKSYSEDNVHKSIKYNVWASTPNGNKKLDAAYHEAQQKDKACPVFLLFSVNTSGQFVGVAEMTGRVDFHKNFEHWQQDKWNGCFPVKWHIVKDISNGLLKHITLENNENKPVTNSRDTQEVKLDQGLQILKIFKENSSKTCILDDFYFYDERQKTIQEKKANQQFQKQVWEGKKGLNGESESQKSSELPLTDSAKEPSVVVEANGDVKQPETESFAKSGEGAKLFQKQDNQPHRKYVDAEVVDGGVNVQDANEGRVFEAKDDENDELSAVAPDWVQYNKVEFPDSKFFVIKSNTEDDVLKSIDNKKWSSTPDGNLHLDIAYQTSQRKKSGSPVFLFFSVNGSGQFVGVAVMTGPVNFHYSYEHWIYHKSIGYFPVKWLILKDVSNSLLDHITLENNENEPVTNSRDTQAVEIDQGYQILEIFRETSSKTSIVQRRQKTIQEKAKQQFQKQDNQSHPKNVDAEVVNGGVNVQDAKVSSREQVVSKKSQRTDQINCKIPGKGEQGEGFHKELSIDDFDMYDFVSMDENPDAREQYEYSLVKMFPDVAEPAQEFVKKLSDFADVAELTREFGWQLRATNWFGNEDNQPHRKYVDAEVVDGGVNVQDANEGRVFEAKDDENDELSAVAPDWVQYNKVEFPDSKFFVIKSNTEDDVLKSIDNKKWSSTPDGNLHLDIAYQTSQRKKSGSPVFLFFSVNGSGQFVGVAVMTGPVNFHYSYEHWIYHKSIGYFPVKWLILKDVSNSLLDHITLENNENEPVTNSRDTQAVEIDQGYQILEIFRETSSKTSIVQRRQKTIQEKAKQQFQKQDNQPHRKYVDAEVVDGGVNVQDANEGRVFEAKDDENDELSAVAPDWVQYNKVEFPDSKFFVIKSNTEDDVLKSIDNKKWSSTPDGNLHLDIAYQTSQRKKSGSPVFLFFSVNGSGQFVGVAVMTGPVNFHYSYEHWIYHKSIGYFPVKWLILKDVSNSLLDHITLENNENEPVTNSRDTQAVEIDQGYQILEIFRETSSKTSIVQRRQKTIQEKAKQQFQKQDNQSHPKNVDAEVVNGGVNVQDAKVSSREQLVSKKSQSTDQINCKIPGKGEQGEGFPKELSIDDFDMYDFVSMDENPDAREQYEYSLVKMFPDVAEPAQEFVKKLSDFAELTREFGWQLRATNWFGNEIMDCFSMLLNLEQQTVVGRKKKTWFWGPPLSQLLYEDVETNDFVWAANWDEMNTIAVLLNAFHLHYFLMVISFESKTVYILDASRLRVYEDSHIHQKIKFIHDFMNARFSEYRGNHNITEWPLEWPLELSEQINSMDSGAYVCFFMDRLMDLIPTPKRPISVNEDHLRVWVAKRICRSDHNKVKMDLLESFEKFKKKKSSE